VSPALTLLDGVRWRGTPIAGARAQTLLAVLVRHGRDGAGDDRLVTELWGEHPPANPGNDHVHPILAGQVGDQGLMAANEDQLATISP
jgi:hypothetical protein